ncbi:MAG: hypothetical protein COV47_03875 [Candidatus Diapherotrites archaeon CG11_big_fil_rev_8_21_14_0_20_37_9]|nr:MAG: hypothetical protein COV47_03875 [Candidatus Diapherotrites archaeon CG11_big_fil_rev_8_21_14_0_20_37_9]
MNNKFKYSENPINNMASNGTFEELFLNLDSLQIMYFLAEKNPNLAINFIAKNTRINEETVTSLITQMIAKQLVTYNEEKKGYTLTRVGLASLYNFHKGYVENEQN